MGVFFKEQLSNPGIIGVALMHPCEVFTTIADRCVIETLQVQLNVCLLIVCVSFPLGYLPHCGDCTENKDVQDFVRV